MTTTESRSNASGTASAAGPAQGFGFHKPGQGKAVRWTAYLLLALVLFLGVRSLYAWINEPGKNVWATLPVVGALSLYKAIALFVFLVGLWGLHLVLNRPSSVDLMIETEQELRRVSWPAASEVKTATLVVVLVTVVMGAILFWADEGLQFFFRFFF